MRLQLTNELGAIKLRITKDIDPIVKLVEKLRVSRIAIYNYQTAISGRISSVEPEVVFGVTSQEFDDCVQRIIELQNEEQAILTELSSRIENGDS